MSGVKRKESRASSATTFTVAGLLLCSYFLSPMPVWWVFIKLNVMQDHEETVEQTMGVIYWPVGWLYDNVPVVEAFYDAYARLLGLPGT